MGKWMIAAVLALVLVPPAGAARAEVSELRMATQFGIGAMAMILMQKNQVLERQLAAAGLPATKVSWRQFPGGNPMNEGLLSGSLDIVSGGTTVFITLWAKAKGSPQAVRSIGAISALPLWFMTRNPNVNRLEDLSDKDKIALTTVKVSVHAILLQMAAEKIYGPAQSGRFDALTVGISHGDAVAALVSGVHEINNHFSAPPFQYVEARAPGVRRITTAQDILGSPASYMVAYATERFRTDNPKTYAAFVAALDEVITYINRDPRAAAKDYLEASKDPITLEEAVTMITDPGAKFTTAPTNVMTFAEFMAKQGLIKARPGSWKDMFFPELYGLPGS
ncbi:MAG TPA: ABC transporter substrate-binding protein [Xanthobacteraceae bacterium]|nr:ABC transporter substrate-binding protein [Xanthobacteraceae bacterium]